MILAILHSSALALVATVAVLLAFGRDLERLPSAVNPVVSTLGGCFLGILLVNVSRASSRAPRVRLTKDARTLVALSGCVVGFFGLAVLAVGARIMRL